MLRALLAWASERFWRDCRWVHFLLALARAGGGGGEDDGPGLEAFAEGAFEAGVGGSAGGGGNDSDNEDEDGGSGDGDNDATAGAEEGDGGGGAERYGRPERNAYAEQLPMLCVALEGLVLARARHRTLMADGDQARRSWEEYWRREKELWQGLCRSLELVFKIGERKKK